MATNRVATPFAGMNVSQMVGDNFAEWTPFANIAAGFVVNDVVYLIQIPNFATLYEFVVAAPGLDTGTSLTISIGDNITTTNGGVGGTGYFNASTASRSSAVFQYRPNNNANGWQQGSVPKTYSITNTNLPVAGQALSTTATGAPAGIWLTMTITAAAQTAITTGSIYGYVKYSYTPSTGTQTNPAL